MKSLQNAWSILSEAASDWVEDNAARMGAALAFYSVLSLAPLLLIALSIAGMFFDQGEARTQLLGQMNELVGKEGADAMRAMLDQETPTRGVVATTIGIVTLLFGASGVFGELQTSMDAVWDVKPKPMGIFGMLKARFLSFAMVLGTGFLLVVSLLMSTVIAGLHASMRGRWPELEVLWHGLSWLVTFLMVSGIL